MSCQVCHRMICRCGPDLTEALRAQLAEARAEARCAQHGMQQLLEGLLEIDRCATAIIGSNDVQDYAVAVEQAERIGMIVTQITHIAEKATLTELPK